MTGYLHECECSKECIIYHRFLSYKLTILMGLPIHYINRVVIVNALQLQTKAGCNHECPPTPTRVSRPFFSLSIFDIFLTHFQHNPTPLPSLDQLKRKERSCRRAKSFMGRPKLFLGTALVGQWRPDKTKRKERDKALSWQKPPLPFPN